ncbi:MAG: NAD(P)/FAD-dependent oxidoreductase [Acidimicrobiia bacterium]|nr:NAD(P)/FAD-dependent oxidoreductase [Acidimicrobiia bacterium]
MSNIAVIGAGPNGLGAAIVLQQAGRSVTVYERSDTVGGATGTAELTLPGFRHDLGAAVHPLGATSPLFQSLPMEEHGLRWLRSEIPLAHPFEDGTAAALHHSVTVTAERLEADGPLYERVVGKLARQWDLISEAVFGPVLRIPSHPLALSGLGWRGLRPAGLAQRSLRTGPGRALLAGLAAHTPMPLSKPGNTAVALVLAALVHESGWPVAEGGSQAIADALASILREMGGTIETNRHVRHLGDIPPVETVLFDTGPRAMAAIAGERLSNRAGRRYRRYRHGPGVFKVDFALAGPVPWSAPDCRKAGTLHLGGPAEEIARAEQAAWDGKIPLRPFVIASQPTIVDPTRAPVGRHVLWTYCHIPAGSDVDMTESIERQIDRFAPGFRDLILARHAMGPADLEEWNPNLVGGDIAGGRTDRLRMLFRPGFSLDPYTVGPGLYLGSSSTPPGPGVHGMAGYHAARAVLRDFS